MMKDTRHKNCFYSYWSSGVHTDGITGEPVVYVLSNDFLSDLSGGLRNSSHSFNSSTITMRNEGLVRPIYKNMVISITRSTG